MARVTKRHKCARQLGTCGWKMRRHGVRFDVTHQGRVTLRAEGSSEPPDGKGSATCPLPLWPEEDSSLASPALALVGRRRLTRAKQTQRHVLVVRVGAEVGTGAGEATMTSK